MRRPIIGLLALPLVALAAMPAHAAPKVVTVFTDPAGDTTVSDENVSQLSAAGLDIVKGTITRSKNDLKFSLTFGTAFSSNVLLPEAARVLWQFTANKTAEYRFTLKSVDVGKPDPVQQDGTDRIGDVYQAGEFRLELCGAQTTTPAISFSKCVEVKQLTGTINVTAKTMTWSLPMSVIKAKTGSIIQNGRGQLSDDKGCNICVVTHYAERSLTPSTVFDQAIESKAGAKYIVPKP